MRKIYLTVSLLAIIFVIAVAANAATFNVTTQNDTLDADPGDGVCADAGTACSLRAAIGEANALAGADTIVLVPGSYTQTLVAANEDANLGGDWDITSVMTITGTGESNTFLQAAATVGTAVRARDKRAHRGRSHHLARDRPQWTFQRRYDRLNARGRN